MEIQRVLLQQGFWPLMPENITSKDYFIPDGRTKALVDFLHREKILQSDYVLVLTVAGYMGDATRAEIAFAQSTRRPILYWNMPEQTEHYTDELWGADHSLRHMLEQMAKGVVE